MSKLETASVLAFEKCIDVSDGVFWQCDSQESESILTPVKISEKSVRGTISNRLKNAIASNPVKLDAEIQKANLQTVDVAMLDADKDTLVAKYSCKILPFNGKPSVCNNLDYQEAVLAVVNSYVEERGVAELAKRYATNMLNARWLWRNRLGSQAISIDVRCTMGEETHHIQIEDAKALSLNSFDASHSQLDELAALIEKGFKGEAFVILYLEARAVVGYGQEVFPSQELILDTGKSKSKVLYAVGGQAGMHSQKIGNAIRTIDTWYENEVEFPIAIEPYGAVTTLGTAFRQPKQKKDFYSLFDNWVLKGNVPPAEEQHYVMGVLIRGGVFGASGKE